MEIPHYSQLVFKQAKKNPNSHILYYRDDSLVKWIGLTWKELAQKVTQTASAMASLGIREFDKVAIYSQNKPHNIIVDFANFSNRAVSVPMYATASAPQIEYIINDANVPLIFVGEQQQYDNALEVLGRSEILKKIVVFDESVDLKEESNAMYFSRFLELGLDEKNEKTVFSRRKSAQLDDLAIILYTSGTTGEPKGVMLQHSNLVEAMRIHDVRMTEISKREKSLAFLPLSHIFERGWTYFCLLKGVKVYLNFHPQDIQRAIREVRPNYMCSVPRFWEKVAIGIEQKIEEMSPIKKGFVSWAIAVGKSYNLDYLRLGKKPSLKLWIHYQLADKLIFSKVKKTVGLENGKMFPTAGAAMDTKLAVFFRSLGIPIAYGYGLTETFATVSCYDYKNYKLGSVGSLMPDVQVKIGDDNEILVKAKTVTSGYYNKPEATNAAFVDGWFKTGDSGKLDAEGHVMLVDRIKDLFKTSNGKYIAPQQIETRLGANRYIEQIAVIGNDRNYVTAIVAPAVAPLKEFAAEHEIAYERFEDLFENRLVQQLYEQCIEEGQEEMASFEKIKKFRLIKNGFTIESGELTSTLKLRRAVILQNYKMLIDEMYDNTPKGPLMV